MGMRPVLRRLFGLDAFLSSEFRRYSWPIEFVVRAIKETGWVGYSVDSALNPMLNMGQALFEPPDVNGWDLGPGWFSTSSMLSLPGGGLLCFACSHKVRSVVHSC